ncbi:MAG: class I SAM-dependent methyltransferase [Planctomycetota bacterium]|nr:class I SAM-dependent methyltransferase [Planctomycetota bacterium]
MSNSELQASVNGAVHSSLRGAANQFRYRSDRTQCDELNFAPSCTFEKDGDEHALLNLSSAGLAVRGDDHLTLSVGQIFENTQIHHNGVVFWEGSVEVSSISDDKKIAGLRVIAGHIDLQELHYRDEFLGYRLDKYLTRQQQQSESLPLQWQAQVGQLHSMLCELHSILDSYQRSDVANDWREQELSRKICAATFQKWAPRFLEIAAHLDELSSDFSADTKEKALSFSQALLMRELIHGEVQRRAYEKPQGYAGDFRMMELIQANHLEGDSLFQRFLLFFAQQMSLGQTVRARSKVAFDAVTDVANLGRPCKIVSLASGPAMELRKFLQEVDAIEHKMDVYLIDQDEDALRNCLNALNKICAERGDNPQIEFHCLHFSLRQVIAPKKGAEAQLVNEVLMGADLVYSMGLFDYLPQKFGRRTAAELFELVRPGGKVLIGNLVRSADSSWLIEYASAWHLIYRDYDSMRDMAQNLDAEVDVIADETGRCLFLQALK